MDKKLVHLIMKIWMKQKFGFIGNGNIDYAIKNKKRFSYALSSLSASASGIAFGGIIAGAIMFFAPNIMGNNPIAFILNLTITVFSVVLSCWLYKSCNNMRKWERAWNRSRNKIDAENSIWNYNSYEGQDWIDISVNSRLRENVRYQWYSDVSQLQEGYMQLSPPKLAYVDGADDHKDVLHWAYIVPEEKRRIEPNEIAQHCNDMSRICNRLTNTVEILVTA